MATEQTTLPGAAPGAAELEAMRHRAEQAYIAWKESSRVRAGAQNDEKRCRKEFERAMKGVTEWTEADLAESYSDDDDDDGTDE